MTAEELRAKYPELIAEVEEAARASVDHTDVINAAVQAERARLAGIDEVAALFDPNLVRAAKYDDPCTAAEMTLKAAQAAAARGSKFLADAQEDAKNSGAADVGSIPGSEDEVVDDNDPEIRLEKARAVVKQLLEKKEEKA